jgi:hypothetical protein
MENESDKLTVAGNAASELTDEKINSAIAMFGRYILSCYTDTQSDIYSIFAHIYEQVSEKINKELRKIALDVMLDVLTLIGHVDTDLVNASHIAVESSASESDKAIYFSVYLQLKAGVSKSILQEVLDAPYTANLYWVEIFDGLLELQFEMVM